MIVAHTAIPEEQFGDYKKRGFDGFYAKAGDESEKNLKDLLRKVDLVWEGSICAQKDLWGLL